MITSNHDLNSIDYDEQSARRGGRFRGRVPLFVSRASAAPQILLGRRWSRRQQPGEFEQKCLPQDDFVVTIESA